MRQTYGDLVRVDADAHREAEVLRRVPLGSNVTSGGVDEATLQGLAFSPPQTLPISDIDPAYAGAVPICKELNLPAGYADALYCNQLGRLTLSEFKLWRNPQARREVIGQILDYAKDLAGWGYDDLQRQVSLATRKSGNVLYDSVRRHHPEVEEAEFVDNVVRHLRRGEFLLLIVGDGIREDAADIVDFVQRYSGLHFNLAMVEAALYRDSANALFVQPRILARTEIVQRFVIDGDLVGEIAAGSLRDQEETLSDQDQQNLRFWSAVVRDFSFADTSVEVPAATTDSTLYILVQGSGFGGYALCFDGYLHRKAGQIGCFLTARKDYPREVRIFESIVDSLDKLREEAAGELDHWENASGRPRIGFRRQIDLAFLAEGEESENFRDAAVWMRDHLNLLVSTVNPRLQALLADEN